MTLWKQRQRPQGPGPPRLGEAAGIHPRAPGRNMVLPTPGLRTPGLQSWGSTQFRCLRLPICGSLLQQPEDTGLPPRWAHLLPDPSRTATTLSHAPPLRQEPQARTSILPAPRPISQSRRGEAQGETALPDTRQAPVDGLELGALC